MTVPDEQRIVNADRAIEHAREMFKVNDAHRHGRNPSDGDRRRRDRGRCVLLSGGG
jgi:hypothetical protein